MEAKVLKKIRSGTRGYKCLIECNVCGDEKWVAFSRIKNGAGKHCSKKCADKSLESLRMEKSHRWKGGRVKLTQPSGRSYWFIKQKDGSYKREHTIIMEGIVGRPLYAKECVHHIDNNGLNNAIENMKLMTKSEHHALHWKEMEQLPNGKLNGKKVSN